MNVIVCILVMGQATWTGMSQLFVQNAAQPGVSELLGRLVSVGPILPGGAHP